MILLKNAVSFDDAGKVFFDDVPFTGILFDMENGIVKSKSKFKNGFLSDGEVEIPFTLYLTSNSEIDGELLEGNCEPYLYEGQLFNGIAYFFISKICVAQKQYERGEVVSEAKYAKGRLIYLEHAEPDDSFTQKFIWSEDGDIAHLSIFSREQFHIGVHFEKGNDVSLLIFNGDYFKYIDEKRSLLLFDYIESSSFFSSLNGSEELNLSGSSVDNSLLNELVTNGCLINTSRLEIYNTAISNLVCLANLDGLQELYIESDILTKEELLKFKSHISSCYTVFNQEEVLA